MAELGGFDPVYEVDAPKYFDFQAMDASDLEGDSWFDIRTAGQISEELEQREHELSIQEPALHEPEEPEPETTSSSTSNDCLFAPPPQIIARTPPPPPKDSHQKDETPPSDPDQPENLNGEEGPAESEGVSAIPESVPDSDPNEQNGQEVREVISLQATPPSSASEARQTTAEEGPVPAVAHSEQNDVEVDQQEIQTRGRSLKRNANPVEGLQHRITRMSVTKPKEFHFASEKRIQARRSRSMDRINHAPERTVKENTPRRKPVGMGMIPRRASPRRTVETKPFSFEARDRERKVKHEEWVQQQLSAIQKVDQPAPLRIHRPPTPPVRDPGIPLRQVLPVTKILPFHFKTGAVLAEHKKKAEEENKAMKDDERKRKSVSMFRPKTSAHGKEKMPRNEAVKVLPMPQTTKATVPPQVNPLPLRATQRIRTVPPMRRSITRPGPQPLRPPHTIRPEQPQPGPSSSQSETVAKEQDLLRLRSRPVYKANPMPRFKSPVFVRKNVMK